LRTSLGGEGGGGAWCPVSSRILLPTL
jgi:hypothetical protein